MNENTRESTQRVIKLATEYLKLANRDCERKIFCWDISFLIDRRMRSDGLLKSSS